MHKSSHLRQGLLAIAALILLFGPAAKPAHAVAKEIVELQTQVQQLLDAVQRLQSTLDARMGVLEHLAQQSADQVTQVNATVTALQQKISAQNDAVSGKLDTASGQVQSLNDSVDELKARITKLDKTVQDLQTQLQAMQAAQAQAQPGTTGPGATGPGGTANPGQGQGPGETGAAPGGPGTAAGASPAQQAPPLQETLQAGVRDYNAGRYQVAQLHKGFALIAQDKREEGIHELRSLIQRHPQTPEARAARTKLTAMGAKPTTAAPAR